MRQVRKLIIYRGSLDKEQEIIEKYQNKLIVKKDKIFYFQSLKSKKKLRLQFVIITLTVNKELAEELEKILKSSLSKIKKISPEPVMFYSEQVKKAVGGIKSIIFKFSYKTEFSLFDLVATLFIRLLMGHYLINGNKRLATAFLYEVLWSFGFMFYYTSDAFIPRKKHKNKIIYFAKKAEKFKEAGILPEVTKWIKEHIFKKLPFIKNRNF